MSDQSDHGDTPAGHVRKSQARIASAKAHMEQSRKSLAADRDCVRKTQARLDATKKKLGGRQEG